MKLFEILKQQGLFSNDIKTRIKNNQISLNGEVISSDVDLDVCLNSDVLDKFLNISLGDVSISKTKEFLLKMAVNDIEEVLDMLSSKFNVRKNDLDHITFNEAKVCSNTAVILESGQFIADTIRNNKIFAHQMNLFGFENLFDSNIDSELTKYLNGFYFVKISKKDSFILKKNNGRL
jgi:hypothetical protein